VRQKFLAVRPSEKRLRNGVSASACLKWGTAVPPEIRHVASTSIDGFGMDLERVFQTWTVFTNHAMCAVNTPC
jgi:hypothetical protein